jgi:hypothetical protein
MRWCGLILNTDGLDFQASQMLWKGVFHFGALRCLAKLYAVMKLRALLQSFGLAWVR